MTNRTWLEQVINKPLIALIAHANSPKAVAREYYEKLLDSIMAWHAVANTAQTKNTIEVLERLRDNFQELMHKPELTCTQLVDEEIERLRKEQQ